MSFPTSLPSYTATAGGDTPNNTASGVGLSGLLNLFEVDITALGTKVGTGSATPVNNAVLVGNGTGTSTWGSTLAGLTLTTPTLTTPTIASFVNANHTHANSAGGGSLDGTNAITAGTITSPSVAVGFPVQIVSTVSSTVATGTTIIPEDDTIPQNTEGDQYMSLAITPKSATNNLYIHVITFLSNSRDGDLITALFQDSTANALAVNVQYQLTGTGMMSIPMAHTMVAGTTSSTTFKVRAGGHQAGTTTFNGQSGARRFGTTTKSLIVITEYKA